jgi:hypothetical protein
VWRPGEGHRAPLVTESVREIMTFLNETPFLDLEIYRLITISEASPALAEFEGNENDKNKVEFLRGFEFPEVSSARSGSIFGNG